MDDSISFECPGRFKIVSHTSSTALIRDEVYEGLQVCFPLPQALYCICVDLSDGRSAMHRFGMGDILSVPAGLRHEQARRRPTAVVSLMLTQEFLSHALGDRSAPDDAFTARDPFISVAAHQLRDTLRRTSPSPAMVAALATVMVHRLVEAGDQASVGNQAAAHLTEVQQARLERHIEGALDQPLTNESLATWLGLSRWRFVTRFHATYAMAPQAFITERRFKRACRLLDESALSILQIALEVGLSHSHFSRSFLTRFGCTPRDYRDRTRP
ncbi:MAG: helix-turn-helix domain-containing protein [Brevundimonas sp.]